MQPTESPTQSSAHAPLRFDPVVIGTLCGILAAAGYTGANICLRAVAHCDPVWVSCVKAFPTVLVFAPVLVYYALAGRMLYSSPRVLGALAVASVVGQVGGNVVFQWSLGVVGIALSVPLCLGAMILSGVAMGRWMLGERISPRTGVAVAVLIAAIFILSLGASAANQSVAASGPALQQAGFWMLLAGVAAACVSGLSYCFLGVVIRYAAREGTPLPSLLLAIGVVGVTLLSAISAADIGPAAWLDTAPRDFGVMMLAGVFNAFSFWALSKALQLTPITYVNGLNASQTALAAVAGVLFFGEAPTLALGLGVALTALGLLFMRGGHQEAPAPRFPAEPSASPSRPLQPNSRPARIAPNAEV